MSTDYRYFPTLAIPGGTNGQVLTKAGSDPDNAAQWADPQVGTGPAGPAGPAGPVGPPGAAGTPGANGQGLAMGGTTGQVLIKNSGTDYDDSFANTPNDGVTVGVTGNNVLSAIPSGWGNRDVYDSFSRTVASGWGNANTGQAWTSYAGPIGDYSVSGGAGVLNQVPNLSHGIKVDSGSADQDVYADYTWASTVTGGQIQTHVSARHSGLTGGDCYRVLLVLTTSGTYVAELQVVSGGSVTVLAAAFATGAFTPGVYVRMRLQCIGTTIRAKVWLATAPEPSAWQTSVTNALVATGTYLMLLHQRNNLNVAATPVASWDNINVHVPAYVWGDLGLKSFRATGVTDGSGNVVFNLTPAAFATSPVATMSYQGATAGVVLSITAISATSVTVFAQSEVTSALNWQPLVGATVHLHAMTAGSQV